MRIIRYFSHAFKRFKTRITLSITVMVLSLFSQQLSAYQVELEASNGGKIVNADNNYVCSGYCKSGTFSSNLINLFAIADEGYRFAGWDADCSNNLGPICTLRLDRDGKVNATFVKADTTTSPSQAVLLLHDTGEKHTVWNEYVKQHFNNNCPAIYGGVFLEKETIDRKQDVYCYRISFGYFRLLRDSLAAKADSIIQPERNAKPFFSPTYFGHEIRAAVLAILNRHPTINLTLVSHGKSTIATQAYLQSAPFEQQSITGLLALLPGSPSTDIDSERLGYNSESFISQVIDASPEQTRKINAALTNLSNANWPIH